MHRALTELYAYYDDAEPMLSNLLRDLDVVESVRTQFARFFSNMDAAHATLMVGRKGRGRTARRTRAAVGHAMAFTTWRSLVREQRGTRSEAIELMSRFVALCPGANEGARRA